MATESFFEESREQSQVKAEIVEKYFIAWARIISATQRRHPNKDQKLAYVDLFAGPGRYRDGAISTPLKVLSRAVQEEKLLDRLVTIFNDKDSSNARSLEEAIGELDGIKNLKHRPEIWNHEVGDKIAADFKRIRLIPTLAFVDPWGYKGLSLKLVDAFLKDWGCDCIFFFNYARVNAGVSNPLVREHMEALFGEGNVEPLAHRLRALRPQEREAMVIEELAQALKNFGHRFVLPFTFKKSDGGRTTHHLIFVSKSFKGYEVMKDIMASASAHEHQGVPSFSYFPSGPSQVLLFELNRPLDDLGEALQMHFSGRNCTTREVYEEHSVDRPFLMRHYKKVLRDLEESGIISVSGRKSNRGFADYLRISFPKR